MTTTTPQPVPRFDFSATEPVPFGRLVAVELRKTIDTRAGRWLLAAVLLLTAASILLVLAVGADDQRTLMRLLNFAAVPQGLLLPVLGILLVTSEWSQRTALVTFSLTASRSRVVGAKVVAALLLASAAVIGALAVAVAATAAGGREDGFADVTVTMFAVFAGIQLLNVLQGVAYGLILLNTPAAIAIFFLLPSVTSLVFSSVSALEDLAPWLDLGTAQAPFMSGDFSVSAEQLAQTGVTALIWVVIPFVAGWFRVMRAEVK